MKNILKNNKLKIYLYYLLLLIISIFFYYQHNLNADEGVVLNGAWNLFNNQILYTDFFEMIAPGSFYLIYFGFKLFGVKFAVANIISLLMIWGSSIGLYKSLNLIRFNRLNFLWPLFFLLALTPLPIINHNTHNLFFLIWSSYFFLLGLKNNSFKYFAISGLFSGLAIIFLQQKGLIFFGASCLFLLFYLIKNKTNFLKNIFSYLIFTLLPIIPLFFKWSVNVLYQNLIVFPMTNYFEVNKTPFYLLISFLLILFYFIINIKNKSSLINYLLTIQFFLLLSTIPLPDYYHLILIVFPLLILIPSLFLETFTYLSKIIIIVFIIIIMFSFLNSFYTFKPFYSYTKDTTITWLKYINDNCTGKYIYSGPFAPNLYFETQKLNATPFDVLIEKQTTANQFDIALESFKKNQPTCAVLYYYSNIKTKFKHTGNNALENYIKNNYILEYQNNNVFIYHK